MPININIAHNRQNKMSMHNNIRMRLKVQPLRLKGALELWATEETPLAKYAWVGGPPKPRDVLRSKEIPPRDVSLQALEREGVVEVLMPIAVRSPEDVDRVPKDADLIVIGDAEDWFADDAILNKIASLGKPILAEWDNWGYSIHGRISKFRLKKYTGVKRYFTMGAEELMSILNAAAAAKFIRQMRVLYMGRMPSHSVALGDMISFEYLNKRFGMDFVQLSFADYLKAVDSVSDEEVSNIVENWKKRFLPMDGREEKLTFYAKIYKALKNMMEQYGANAIAIDCAALPDEEYVPCLAYSLLIDEGIPCACEADLPALFIMAALMAMGASAMIGNLNENVTHADIEQNIVVLNHDVMPPSFACRGCIVALRDFHATGKGVTPYAKLREETVTLAGMHWDMDKIWATVGKVKWTEDTTHCRISVGIEVRDAKTVSKEAFSHHAVMAYGDYTGALKKLAELLDLEITLL